MNVVLAAKNYVTKMIDESGPGMKAFIMDSETISIVSLVFSQSEILQKEVYLFENIESLNKDAVKQVKALVFVRPTAANIRIISNELKFPRFGKYYLYFSNTIGKSDIKLLAESDQQECVCDIQELFADFYPFDCHHFTQNIWNCATNLKWNSTHLQRCIQGLMAVCLSVKKHPVIRFSSVSPMCKRLAEGLSHQINRETNLFDFTSSLQLFIVDRRSDPITPLLNQWTYEAMTHELFGIHNQRVNLGKMNPNVSKELSEIVLSPLQDHFYRDNLSKTFGEIGVSIKMLMEEFQAKSKSQQQVQSLDDMKRFVENYPQFKKMSGTVSKHVTLVSELSRVQAEQNLLEISELEQDIVCGNNQSDVMQRIKDLVNSKNVSSKEALRLTALYSLRYKTSNVINNLIDRTNPKDGKEIVDALKNYNLATMSSADSNNLKSLTKRFIKDLQGVQDIQNVYTQHKPDMLKDLIDQISTGRLKEEQYPLVKGKNYVKTSSIKDSIIFIVGGSTYEEIAYVDQFNSSNSNLTFILGGTCVHNSKTFIEEVLHACFNK